MRWGEGRCGDDNGDEGVGEVCGDGEDAVGGLEVGMQVGRGEGVSERGGENLGA